MREDPLDANFSRNELDEERFRWTIGVFLCAALLIFPIRVAYRAWVLGQTSPHLIVEVAAIVSVPIIIGLFVVDRVLLKAIGPKRLRFIEGTLLLIVLIYLAGS